MDQSDKDFIEKAKKDGFGDTAKYTLPLVEKLVKKADEFATGEAISEDGEAKLLALLQQAFDVGFETAQKLTDETLKNDSSIPGL